MKTTEHIQLGPSCDLDENGDPKPPKIVKATLHEQPTVRYIGRKRVPKGRRGKARARR